MEYADLAERIKEIALYLVNQRSVVETPDEALMSDRVFSVLSDMEYFRSHPENLYTLPVPGDEFGRKTVVAIMTGEKKPSDKTVVFIGHTDTVGISDYGVLSEYALSPDALLEKFRELPSLSDEVKADMGSGKYMFGRGIFDMKSGDAVIMALMEHIGSRIDDFEGNIVFGAVCDEEGNSRGMLTLVPELIRLAKCRGFDYRAMIDPDYIAPAYDGDPNRYLYVGTVGKLMPTFYIIGKETHVGESFSGLDPNQIAAEITRTVNLNPEFSDCVDGEATLPPITLKQRDLKPEYSVQIASKAILFFNYATHSLTPGDVMQKMLAVSSRCFADVIRTLNERYRDYCALVGREFAPLPWKERTMSFSELCEAVRGERGASFDTDMASYAATLAADKTLDVRDRTQRLVEYVHSLWSDKNPALIVYLTPPYYPHVHVDGSDPRGRALIDAIDRALAGIAPEHRPVKKNFLPCISDLSYATAPADAGTIAALKTNMPGFGILYDLPIADMQKLDLPVADIGCYGKDAHKFTERVETEYSYNILPKIIYDTLAALLNG